LATIQSALGVSFRITGLDSPREASELALLLRAGALAAPMYFVEERTIGPSLGAENVALGIKSVTIGMVLVLSFMLVYYKVFGIFANIALSLNLVILVAAMSILGATLTLPGIAGIVLTVGMAVDANVLIFSRIKEELANGLPPQSAIKAGYDRAFVSIIDANLTTLIVAVILYAIGSGPVQGFAVTLSIGILTSMFTAIVGTRALVNLVFGGRNINKVWI
jgi:preprotein translocase subunit SecD